MFGEIGPCYISLTIKFLFFLAFFLLTSSIGLTIKISEKIFYIIKKNIKPLSSGIGLFGQTTDLPRGGDGEADTIIKYTAKNLAECIKPGHIFELVHKGIRKTYFNEFCNLKCLILRLFQNQNPWVHNL